MNLIFLVLAVSAQATPPSAAGSYEAVTESESSIELMLESSGSAEFEFRVWEAGHFGESDVRSLRGAWSQVDGNVIIRLPSGEFASYTLVPCLSHEEFGAPGCSPGLKLIETSLPEHYGLQRFGLWRNDGLPVQP